MRNLMQIVEENHDHIQGIVEHSKMKILLISSYVENWLRVGCNGKWKKMVFADCMCNAGIYADGTLGTPSEVYKLILDYAKDFSDMKFYIYINDYNENRIKIINEVFSVLGEKPANVIVRSRTYDVNYILGQICEHKDKVFKNALSLVFVDPYDISTVDDEKLFDLLDNCRVELIFNMFLSDFTRFHCKERFKNKKSKLTKALSSLIEEDEIESVTSEELFDKFHIKFKESQYSNYVFSYLFKNRKKADLYYIVFSSPSVEGLKKFKISLWDVFKGYDYYFHDEKKDDMQQTLFPEELSAAEKHGYSAKKILQRMFVGETVSYDDIADVTLERTMLKDTQIIDYVLKPLIETKRLIKHGSKTSYKKNNYTFRS